MSNFKALAVVISAIFSPTLVYATDCSAWSRFSSTEEYLSPLSLKPNDLAVALNTSEYSSGLEVSIMQRGTELWLDITRFPGDAPVVTGTAAIMKVGRLLDADFEKIVLADNDTPLFFIEEPVLREIGCQFIWGREGGENPIHLMRILMKNLIRYETGQPVTTGFTGHLLGDTTLAMRINNEVLAPEWAMSAVP